MRAGKKGAYKLYVQKDYNNRKIRIGGKTKWKCTETTVMCFHFLSVPMLLQSIILINGYIHLLPHLKHTHAHTQNSQNLGQNLATLIFCTSVALRR